VLEVNTAVSDEVRPVSGATASNTALIITSNPDPPQEYGRLKRKTVPAKRIVDALNGCLCGQVLGPGNDGVIECKAKGCETHWVSHFSRPFSMVKKLYFIGILY
jgi:hypothetical protein